MTPDLSSPPSITREQMLPLFAAAVPSFVSGWQAFLTEWKDERELPLYLALNDLARHLIDQLARGEVACFPIVFDLVERCCLYGDAYVQEAVTVGLLEDLQNQNLHATTAPADLEVWLQPRSKAMWEGLNRFWAGEAPFVVRDGPGV